MNRLEMEWRENLARALRVNMRRNHMTQKDLAREIGVSENTITSYMKCIKAPTITTMIRICIVFDCTPNDLLLSEDDYY